MFEPPLVVAAGLGYLVILVLWGAGGFHTKDELIEISSLVPKAISIATFIAQRAAR